MILFTGSHLFYLSVNTLTKQFLSGTQYHIDGLVQDCSNSNVLVTSQKLLVRGDKTLPKLACTDYLQIYDPL